MDSADFFNTMLRDRAEGRIKGIYSVCSANPFVLRAAMEQSAEDGMPVLIEATANQVNQFGGYTGMKPDDFSRFVYDIAADCGFPAENIILGGDHLGPFVWKDKDEAEAMALAGELVAAYARAGFSKIHIDTSMKLASDSADAPLSNETIARRGAVLCAAAEAACGLRPPIYVIGSEVPTPGGPQDETEVVVPTTPDDFVASYQAFKDAFVDAGLDDAFSRVVAFVVQPGVEFTDSEVFEYDRDAAAQLCAALHSMSGSLVFEGHSTDYQTPASMRKLVEDGVAILKVGPALTFALRQGFMALESIERELVGGAGLEPSRFTETLEAAMLRDDSNWKNHYSGDAQSLRIQLRYSFFDRARYYLPEPDVNAAVERLIDNLDKTGIPITMLSQYLPQSFERVRAGLLSLAPRDVLIDCVKHYLRDYSAAVR